ncbi:MAG: RidA family protein [Roseibium album]|uniref:RidA family protein n=1 Tax=Roseibium album TaxID=311410 RepID=UPI0032EE04F6
MSDRINPDTLYNSVQWGFSHAAVSEPGRLLHLAGQVAWDKDCQLVGGDDLNAQARQCLANLKAVLADQGLGPQHLIRLRTYVVNHTPEKLEPVGMALGEFWGKVTPAPNTWLGVQSLALPEFLVEIEGTAVLP